MRLAASHPYGCKFILIFAAISVLIFFMGDTRPLLAQTVPRLCFAVSDGYLDEEALEHSDQFARDTLVHLDVFSGETGAVSNRIPNMLTSDIEAIAFQPGGENLYAANGNQLGVIHQPTATFTPRTRTFGNAQGYRAGSLTTIALDDVDSLSFDPTSGGKLWGVNRNNGADILFQIDPATGSHIAGVFSIQGTAVDFVEIQAQHDLYDIDDIAIDPTDGQMYGIMNEGGGPSYLVGINTATGQTADLGRFARQDTGEEIRDMEGLAFFNDGQLYSSTGKDWRTGRNILWKIDKENAIGQLQGEFRGLFRDPSGQPVSRISDIEALACLSAPAFVMVEKQLNGDNADSPPGVAILQDSAFTWRYQVRNTSGLPLTNISVTDNNGTPDDDTDDFVACIIDRLLPGETNQDARISCIQDATAVFGAYHTIATVTATYIDPITERERTLTHSDPAYYMGYIPPAVGDYVWLDTNKNGLQDSFEPPVPNVTVNLYETQVGQDDGRLVQSKTTDEQGFYLFEELDPGEYYLEFDLSTTPFDNFTVNSQGSDRKLDSDAIVGGESKGRTPPFSLSNNTTDQSWDAGLLGEDATASLGDLVWHDGNGNGFQDEGELALSGVPIQLLDIDGTVIQSATTDINGRYRFTELESGDYILQVTTPTGFMPTIANSGPDDTMDSDFQITDSQQCEPEQPCNPMTQLVNLNPGETALDQDAGYWQPATIGGQVWHDENADGLRAADETGLADIPIHLINTQGERLHTITTDAEGKYFFSTLSPGIYHVEIGEDEQSANLQLSPPTEENSFLRLDSRTLPLTLISNTAIEGIDAALFTAQADLQITLIPASTTCDPMTLPLCDPVTDLPVGTILRYIYQIDNPGNQPLTDVQLTDENCSPITFATGDSNANSLLDPAERWVYSCEQTLAETTNIVAQVVARPLNDPTAATLEREVAIIINSVQASFAASVRPSADVVQPGTDVTLDYEVENTGDVPLTAPEFTTEQWAACNAEITMLQGSDTNNNDQLDSGETWRYRCQITVQEDAQIVTTILAQDSLNRSIERQTVTHIDVINPIIELAIDATESCTPATPEPCDPNDVMFTYTVQNPGDDPITDLALNDAVCQEIALDSGDDNLNNQLDPGETWRYHCQTNSPESRITTQATISGSDSQGEIVRDSATLIFLLSQPSASLGDRVWEDLNRNGLQDPGEPGLAGITVRLLDSQETLRTATTDATGRYEFSDLPPGNYRFFVTQPEQYDFTLPNQSTPEDLSAEEQDSDVGPDGSANPFTLNAGQTETKMDAGLVLKPATLGDFVWEDQNGNGLQDADEPGVVGIQVRLWGLARGNTTIQLIDEMVTDVAGRYYFDNLDSTFTYVVEFVPTESYEFTLPNQSNPSSVTANDALMDSDADPENGRTQPFALTAGQQKTSIDAGLINASVTISNRIWLDRNQDGLEAPNEPGVGGVTILLWLDKNQDGTPDSLVDSQITENDGIYRFEELEPEQTYFLQVVPESDQDFTTFGGPTDPTLSTSSFDPDTGLSPAFKPGLCNSAALQLCNFAAGIIPARATIGDRIWEDTNGDGIQGQPSDEPPLANIFVRLWRDNDRDGIPDEQIASTASDNRGHYSFADLDPDPTYFVEFALPAERKPTLARQGDSKLDSDATAEGCSDALTQECSAATSPIVLTPGSMEFSIDLGILPIRYRISGAIWDDVNQNSSQDGTEPALSETVVQLWIDSDEDGEPDTPGRLLTVAENGTYEATNLDPNLVYFIHIEPSDGYGLPVQATIDHKSGFSPPLRYTTSEPEATLDAGLVLLPATLHGLVWDDRNRDGIRDRNEPGVGNIQVALMTGDEVDNDVIFNVTTNPVGDYRLDGILPGPYRIIFVSPNGFTFSPQNQGTEGELFSAPDPNTGITPPFIVAQTSGQILVEQNAGLIPAGNRSYRFESRIEGQDADSVGQAVQANPLDKLRFSYTLVNTGDRPLNWVTLKDDTFGELTDACALPISVPVEGEHTCTLTRDAADVAAGQQNIGTATVLGVGSQSDEAWYQTDPRYVTVGDFIWADDNQDGLQDSGESGLSNIEVELLDALGVTIAKTVSDVEGFYQFVGLEPSSAAQNQTYRIHFVRPTTLTYFTEQTVACDQEFCTQRDSDANPSSGRTMPFEPTAGERLTDLDAGLYNLVEGRPAAIGDHVWEDLNGNGLQEEDEPAVANVQVRLLDNNGLLRSSTLTDDEGRYQFTELAPASYVMEFVAPSGYKITAREQGIDLEQDSDPDPATRKTPVIRLGLGEENQSIDAGLYRPARLSGMVWLDEDGDGRQGPGEPGIADIAVDLYAFEGTEPLAMTQTDPNGIYTFQELAPGDYYVIVQKPEVYEFTRFEACESAACHAENSDANPLSGVTQAVFVPSGGHDESLDAGLLTSLSISGRLWADRNFDGLQSPGEPGIAPPGATVQLLDGETGTTLATQTLADDSAETLGRYQFNVNPGQYQVRFSLPAGYALSQWILDTLTELPTEPTLDSDPDPSTGTTKILIAETGGSIRHIDAGIQTQLALGDRVWSDLNSNGIQDSDEPGLDGITLRLYDETNQLLATTQSQDGGSYEFTNLAAGKYQAEVVIPDGFQITEPDQSTDENDSDIDPETARSPLTNLDPAALQPCSSITLQLCTLDIGLVAGDAAITLEKYTNGHDADQAPGPEISIGQPVVWEYVITNVGQQPLTKIQIRDDRLGFVTDGCPQNNEVGLLLEPGESITCRKEGVAEAGQYQNSAMVQAFVPGRSGDYVQDEDQSHYFGGGVDLSVMLMENEDPANAGSPIYYTLVYTNNGPATARNVQLIDELPEGVLFNQLISSDPETALPAVTWVPESGMRVVWTLDAVTPGESGEIVFEVDTDPSLNGDTILNSITITAATLSDLDPSNNDDDEETTFRLQGMGFPTSIELLEFSARPDEKGLAVRWVTAAEVNSKDFRLLRSVTPDREDAVEVTPLLIKSVGEQGGEYEFLDRSALAGLTYHYWLLETEITGKKNHYGPISEEARLTDNFVGPFGEDTFTIYLPIVNEE